MTHVINTILVLRSLPNMINAIATQGSRVIAFGLEDGIANHRNLNMSERLSKGVGFFPMDYIRRNRWSEAYKYISILGKLIRNEKPDIVHVNALQDLFLTYIAVLLFSFPKNRPVIVAMSHNPAKWKDSRRAWLGAKAIEFFTDGFICLATTHKKQLVSLGVSPHKITVIPNPYEVEQIELISRQKDRLSVKQQKDNQIIYVANICKRKAQDVLLRAAAQVLEKYPNTTFHFVGKVLDGEEQYSENLYTLQKELHIGENIHFTGGVEYKTVLDMVARSDVFVFPSHSEMMPRAVVEAMLLGKPIIASSVDGILDLIDHRKTGILIEPGSPEGMASAICELIEQPSFAKLLGDNAQEYASSFCSPQLVGKSFLDFYQQIKSQT